MIIRGTFCLLLLCATRATVLVAQAGGNVHGVILDPVGNPVPEAAVRLFLPAGERALREAATNSRGQFVIVDVSPEYYDLVLEAKGYNRDTLRNVKVEPGRPTVLAPVRLRTGEFDQPTTTGGQVGGLARTPPDVPAVTAVAAVYPAGLGSSAEIRDISNAQEALPAIGAEIGSTVTRDQVQGLPVLDRDPMRLIQTQAGVVGGFSPAGQASVSSFTVVNGLRPSYANMTLEGVNIQRNYVRANALESTSNRIFLDQISEFTVITANAPASYGGGASQVAFSSPAGTNRFHGSGYWLHRNDALKANGWQLNRLGIQQNSFQQNQAGGSVQGPVVKDRLLFYLNFEAFTRREQIPTTRVIPTASARRGIVRYVTSAGGIGEFNALEETGGRFDPILQKVLDAVPGPDKINNPNFGDGLNSSGYTFAVNNDVSRQHVTSKIDWNASQTQAAGVTFLWMNEHTDRPDLSNNYGAAPAVYNYNTRRVGSGYWRWNPTARTTNEVRAGMNLAPANFLLHSQSDVPLVSAVLFVSPVNFFQPQTRTDDTYTFRDGFTVAVSSHTLEVGIDMYRFHTRFFDALTRQPTYFLNPSSGLGGVPSIPDLEPSQIVPFQQVWAALTARLQQIQQIFVRPPGSSSFVPGAPVTGELVFHQTAGFVHDVWKVHPRLTMSLGLRYELLGVPYEANGRTLTPHLIGGDPVKTLLSDATLDFVGGKSGGSWFSQDRNNFAPQAGIAWDIFGTRQWVFRGGYSFHYVNDEYVRASEATLAQNPGLQQTRSVIFSAPVTLSAAPQLQPLQTGVPLTFSQALALNPAAVFAAIDPNLQTPYVQEWTASFEHGWRGTVFSFRYVGNHSVKSVAVLNVNQPDLTKYGFLNAFRATQQYLASSGPATPSTPCSSCGVLNNLPSVFATFVRSGQAGELAYQLGQSGILNLYPGPLTNAAALLQNGAGSVYHGLQIEATRGFRRGLHIQANYTFGKVLSDTGDSAISQTRVELRQDYFNERIARARAAFDITHALKANWIYQLPFDRISGRGGFTGRLLSGWSTSGILSWQSGPPFSLLSAWPSFNRMALSGLNTANSTLTKSELADRLRFQMDGRGGIVGARLSPADYSNPPAGTIGTLQQRLFSGPPQFNLDLAVLKSMRIRESHAIEFRCEASNALNHTNWLVLLQNINTQPSAFGRNVTPINSAREVQLGLIYRF
jgi:hypothetical protein